MQISFIHPVFAFLLLALPALWLLGSRHGFQVHRILRALTLALLILAMTQPVLMTSLPKEHHAIIVDQSASLDPEARSQGADIARRLLAKVEDDSSVTVLQIGGSADAAISDHTIRLLPGVDESSSLSQALEMAAQSIPYGLRGSVALISDGETTEPFEVVATGRLGGVPVVSEPRNCSQLACVAPTVRASRSWSVSTRT